MLQLVLEAVVVDKVWEKRALTSFALIILFFSAVSALQVRSETTVVSDLSRSTSARIITDFCQKVNTLPDALFTVSFIATRYESSKSNQNLFQTASLNEGLRLELDTEGRPALLFSNENATLSALQSTRPMWVDQPISVLIEWRSGGRFTLSLGGEQVSQRVQSKNKIQCDNFKIGSGYDASRIFIGEINDLEVALVSSAPILKLSSITKLLLGSALGFLLFFRTSVNSTLFGREKMN